MKHLKHMMQYLGPWFSVAFSRVCPCLTQFGFLSVAIVHVGGCDPTGVR